MAIKVITSLIATTSLGGAVGVYFLYDCFFNKDKKIEKNNEIDAQEMKNSSQYETEEKIKVSEESSLKKELKEKFKNWRESKKRYWWNPYEKIWSKKYFFEEFCPAITDTGNCEKEFEKFDEELSSEVLRKEKANCRLNYWFAWKYKSNLDSSEEHKCSVVKNELEKWGIEYNGWDFKNNGEWEYENRLYFSSTQDDGTRAQSATTDDGNQSVVYTLNKDNVITKRYVTDNVTYVCIDSEKNLECNEGGIIKRYNTLGWYID